MFDRIRADYKTIFEMDPAATSRLAVILTYSGFHAILVYRFAHWLHGMGMTFFARVLSQLARFLTGVEIHPAAKIGGSFFIDHGMGVVVGETSEIGEHVTLFQGVTLGGTGKERGKRHPTLGNNVVVGAGAKVLGGITIGDHVKIGANAVVLHPVPPHSTVVGVPGRVVRVRGRRPMEENELDHVHMPDPMDDLLTQLQNRLERLEQKQGLVSQPVAQMPSGKKQSRRKTEVSSSPLGLAAAGELPIETVEERQARMARMEKEERMKDIAIKRARLAQEASAGETGGTGGAGGTTGEPKKKKPRRRRKKPANRDAGAAGMSSAADSGEGGAGRPTGTDGAENV